jgi:hypothetical protein
MAKINLHVPDFLILPFGRAVKNDLQKITLSAVSADGLYFSTDVPIIFIRKADKQPICLGAFTSHFGDVPFDCYRKDDNEQDQVVLDYMCKTLKAHNPNMTKWEEMFLDLYFTILKTLAMRNYEGADFNSFMKACKSLGIWEWAHWYTSDKDVWCALLPIPELQLYVQDPLAETLSFQPDNNFRVDYGFWDGEKLIAVEIDGAEPEGYARDIRRDRLLKRAGVEVIHIMNMEIAKHRAHALVQLLPRKFFGYDWNYEGNRPWPGGDIPF